MSTALYRKYRPKTFDEVVGQNHIKITLQNEIETGRVTHAYLFCGPRGVGKTTMARLLAKSLNCLNRKEKESEPCNQCDSCREIMAGHALDLIEIDAASHTGVDNVRENIIEGSRFTPSSRKFKVFIIDEVHMLSVAAFNALLKTLEEPPSHVVFILATTEVHKLPATIISRCQRFDFKKVGMEEMVKRLKYVVREEKKEVAEKTLKSVAQLSEGCIRDAESLLGQVLSLDEKKITQEQAELVIPRSELGLVSELIGYLTKKDATKAIFLINKLVEEGVDLNQFIEDLIEFLRKMLLTKISGSLADFTLDLDEDLEKKILDLTQEAEVDYLIKMIENFIKSKQEIKYNEIPQLPLELAVIELCAQEAKPMIDRKDKSDRDDAGAGAVRPEVKSEKSSPEKITDVKSKVDITTVQQQWPEVLTAVKEKNHALALILRVCRVENVRGNKIQLCFQYKFHNEVLQEAKNRKILDEALEKFFGQGISFEGLIKEDETQTAIGNLLETFGGELVN